MNSPASQHDQQPAVAAPTARPPRLGFLAPWAAFLVGVCGHLPALGTYWNEDDWGLLGRAAGLIERSQLSARLLSQDWYWRLAYPLFGIAPDPYAWTRLFLHGGSAALVAKIAGHGGCGTATQLAAGILFAATPLAFTPLYWASGVQELLGAFLALAALERWLAAGRLALPLSLAAGIGAILAKENALGLPILLTALLWARRPSGAGIARARVAAVLLLFAVATAEAFLVLQHFRHGLGLPYALGPWHQSLHSLALYGWWLLTPGPFLAYRFNLAMGLAGWAFWLLWSVWSFWCWRRGNRWPAACVLGAALSLAPALPLQSHAFPYLAYLAAAGGVLTVAALWQRRGIPRPGVILLAAALAGAWSWWGMNARLKSRDAEGYPADPLVRRSAVSYRAVRTLESIARREGPQAATRVLLLQPPPFGEATELAQRLGETWVMGSMLYRVLQGELGPRLALGARLDVRWVNDLRRADPEAFVLVDGGFTLRPWGPTPQALLYLCLTEVARGQFIRAEQHLRRAAYLSPPTIPFSYDPDDMIVPAAAVRSQAARFLEFLGAEYPNGDPPHDIRAMRDIFTQLLKVLGDEPPSP